VRSVRRDDLEDSYWTSHFMFARRMDDTLQRADQRRDRDDRIGRSPQRRKDAREQAIRVLGRVAEGLLQRAGR
jgi:hypothetical protein